MTQLKQKNILIVEDETFIALNIQMELKRWGYGITGIASSGEKALKSVHLNEPDIILMDLNLSGHMDGIDTARKIKEMINLPVIFMTGFTDEEQKQRANHLSPVAYMIKPVKLEDLKTLLETLES